MTGMLSRYVWVYLSHDKQRNVWEWSTWYSIDKKSGLGIPTPHEKIYTRNGARYIVRSEQPLPDEQALSIVRALYEFEFRGTNIK